MVRRSLAGDFGPFALSGETADLAYIRVVVPAPVPVVQIPVSPVVSDIYSRMMPGAIIIDPSGAVYEVVTELPAETRSLECAAGKFKSKGRAADLARPATDTDLPAGFTRLSIDFSAVEFSIKRKAPQRERELLELLILAEAA